MIPSSQRPMLAAVLFSGALACASGGPPDLGPDAVTLRVSNGAGEPVLLRYAFGRSVPITLGSVPADGESRFSLRFSRTGDLRIIADFVERRTGTSNPIMDLRPADVLQLTINQRKELRLERVPAP